MNKLEQAARQALEALEAEFYDDVKQSKLSKAITALREALGENNERCILDFAAGIPVSNEPLAEQEPVAWMCWIDSDEEMNPANAQLTSYEPKAYAKRKPLYAAPVRTKDLTDDEMVYLWNMATSDFDFARAVIAADREKNK